MTKKLFTILIAASLFAACSKDDHEEPITTYHLLRVTADDFVCDEGAFSEDWQWTSDDEIGIYPISPVANNEMRCYYFSLYGVNNNCALFSGRGWDFDKKEEYLAYYPYNSINYTNDAHHAIALDYRGQVQYGNDNADAIKTFDFMYTSRVIRSEEYLDINMSHAGALIKLVLPNKFPDYELKSVILSLTDNSKFVIGATMDLAGMDGSLTVSNHSSVFKIDVRKNTGSENGVRVPEGNSVIVYFLLPPQDLSGKQVEYSLVYTEVGEVTVTDSLPVFMETSIEANRVYLINPCK